MPTRPGLDHTATTQIRNERKLYRNCSMIVRSCDAEIPPLLYIIFAFLLSLSILSLPFFFLSLSLHSLFLLCRSVIPFSCSRILSYVYSLFSVFPFNSPRNVACVFSLIAWDAYARRYGTELLCLTKSITHYRCVHVYTRVRLGIRLLGSLCLYYSG